VEAESSYVSEVRFPGTGTATSADAVPAPGREVTALYKAHVVSLTRLAYVMLGDRPAAEDVVQEAFLGLYRRWNHLRDTASAPGYLRASVLNGCRVALRSRTRHKDSIAGGELPWESAEATALVGISWAANSPTIAFYWMNRAGTIGVRLLDTAASGDNLIADSRLAVIEATKASQSGPGQSGPPDYVSQCVTDSIMSLDGSSIICGYATDALGSAPNSSRTTTGFIRYSAKTGKAAQVYGVSTFNGQADGDISVWWTSATGKTLIGGVLTPSGIRVGVISGQTFTPLPGAGGLGAVAW
jgi:Sigma-70 region 2